MANESFEYLIIGGGMVGAAAAQSIRDVDENATIAIIGTDSNPPIARPALSKKLWTDPEFKVEQAWANTVEKTGATLFLSTTVTAINRADHTVTTDDGQTFGYGKLLIATGSSPNQLNAPASDRVIYFRTFEDYERLRGTSGENQHVLVVGGGYIGQELACALSLNNTKVTLIASDEYLNQSKFPQQLAMDITAQFKEHGVEIRTGKVATVDETHTHVVVHLEDGTEVSGDAVVLGLGVTPNTGLAKDAELEVADGVIVDEHLVTGDPDIFAAGDVANYPDVLLGRSRIEHVDNANSMGDRVGRNMAGKVEAYTHTPFFYSMLYGQRYEVVGALSSAMNMVEDWNTDRSKGVVYYLDGGEVKGVLLWQVPDSTDKVRELIRLSQADPVEADSLAGFISI